MEETKKELPGFHSRSSRPTGKDSTSTAHILLFTDVESMEAAKIKLEKNPDVESIDYMGLRSSKKQVGIFKRRSCFYKTKFFNDFIFFQPDCLENRQLYLKFDSVQSEATIKELDSQIEAVEFMKDDTK